MYWASADDLLDKFPCPVAFRAFEAPPATVEKVGIELRGFQPIDDVRSTADYRMRVATNLVRQFWQETA